MALVKNSTVTALNLGRNRIGAHGPVRIAVALGKEQRDNPLPWWQCHQGPARGADRGGLGEERHLGSGSISARAADRIAVVLENNSTVTTIKFGGNAIDGIGDHDAGFPSHFHPLLPNLTFPPSRSLTSSPPTSAPRHMDVGVHRASPPSSHTRCFVPYSCTVDRHYSVGW